MTILLATSLAPRPDDPVQHRAVQSWIAAGFSAVSLNIPEEIAVLSPAFPDVAFVPLSRDGRAVCGRPLPAIVDMLAFLAETGADVVGLINADIVLTNVHTVGAAEAAAGHLICGARLDVDCLETGANPASVQGFDYFLFPRQWAADFSSASYHLGMPYWDYWFPAVAALRGHPLMITVPPVAWHLAHPQRWGDRALLLNAIFTAEMLDELERTGQAEAPSLSHRQGLSTGILRHYQQALLQRVYGEPSADPQQRDHADLSLREFGDFFAGAIRAFVEASARPVDLRAIASGQ